MKQSQDKRKFRVFFAGFAILAAMTLLLYGLSTVTALVINLLIGLLLLAAVLGILYKLFSELIHNTISKIQEKVFSKENLKIFTAVFIGAVGTYALSIYAGLGPVLASGLVGVAAAIFLPKYAPAIFCGSFAGMSSSLLVPPFVMLLAGGLAGILFVLSKNILNGFGGKFGTIAFSGVIAAALLTGKNITSTDVVGWDIGLLLVAFSITAAVITYSMSVRLKLGPVLASGMMGVMAGIFLPLIFPATGTSLSVMVFCASFIGMSAQNRIKNEIFIALAGIIAGLAFIYSAPLQGAGGKLGTIAFGSVLSISGFMELYSKMSVIINNKKTMQS